jgi:predicted PhzF superfamily epimerase YddE/YHI9
VAEVGFCGHATIATAVQDIDKAVFYPDDEQSPSNATDRASL